MAPLTTIMQFAPLIGLYLACWGILYVVGWKFNLESRGLTIGPFYAVYRTNALNKKLGQIASRGRWVWRVLMNIALAVGLGQMILILFQLIRNAFYLFFRTEQAGPVQVLIPIPGVTMSWENFPYVVAALCVLVLTHEAAHAIASLVEGIPLRSAGLFFAVAVPGAMVEVDDEKMEKSKYSSQLRVFAAGSSANLAVAMIALLLMSNFALTISPFYETIPSGVEVGGFSKGYFAETSGMHTGDVIQAINSIKVTNLENLRAVMSNVKPGEVVKIETARGTFEVKTAPDPSNAERAVIGVTQLTNRIVYSPRLPLFSPELPRILFNLEFWMYFIMVSVSMINMLPLFPLDGDKYLHALLGGLGLRNAKSIRSIISAFSFTILATNILLSYAIFGFTKL